jgi:DNA-binding NarL/FixJ family response regulator
MLALIATDDIHAIRAAMRLRIHGLVHRDTTREELLAAVRACLHGEGYVSNSLATAVARAAMGLEDRRHLDLTERQQEIAKMVCAGMSSVEIARVLGISRRTVEFHRTRILKKLGVHTAVEMAQLLALISAHNQEDVNVIPSIPA